MEFQSNIVRLKHTCYDHQYNVYSEWDGDVYDSCFSLSSCCTVSGIQCFTVQHTQILLQHAMFIKF